MRHENLEIIKADLPVAGIEEFILQRFVNIGMPPDLFFENQIGFRRSGQIEF